MKKTITKKSITIFLLFALGFTCNISYAQWTQSSSTVSTSNINDPIVRIYDASGADSPDAAKLELLEYNYNYGAYLAYDGNKNKFHIGTKNNGTNASAITVIRNGGRVGIGTENPESGFMLSVNGRIKSRGILCSVDGWADFVFKSDYQLRPLSEVADFIAKNGHLPEVPSEQEVMEHGIELQVMDQKLLQKVEELTLYIIMQQKELDQLKQQFDNLKN